MSRSERESSTSTQATNFRTRSAIFDKHTVPVLSFPWCHPYRSGRTRPIGRRIAAERQSFPPADWWRGQSPRASWSETRRRRHLHPVSTESKCGGEIKVLGSKLRAQVWGDWLFVCGEFNIRMIRVGVKQNWVRRKISWKRDEQSGGGVEEIVRQVKMVSREKSGEWRKTPEIVVWEKSGEEDRGKWSRYEGTEIEEWLKWGKGRGVRSRVIAKSGGVEKT